MILRSLQYNLLRFRSVSALRPWYVTPGRTLHKTLETGNNYHEKAASLEPSYFTFLPSSNHQPSGLQHITKGIKGQRIPPHRTPLLALLVTPEYSNWLNGDQELVRRLLTELFIQPVTNQKVNVLVAVIDAVSLPKRSTENGFTAEELAVISAHRNPNGQSGISVAVLDTSYAASNLWADQNILRTLPKEDGVLPHLTFDFRDLHQQCVSIQLPLANTIFQNGRDSTMFLQRWVNAASEDNTPKLQLESSKNMVQQAIMIPRSRPLESSETDVSISYKLRRLTPPRGIVAASGNILRQLANDEGSPQPASLELEAVINEEVRKEKIANRPVEVWALVTPQNSKAASPGAKANKETSRFYFETGSQLFKVLSGGGGWGQKQGLLSLEPKSDFGGKPHPSQRWRDTENQGIYAELMRVGDIVTFLTIDPVEVAYHEAVAEKQGKYVDVAVVDLRKQILEFGCVPSRVDDMPDAKGLGRDPDTDLPHVQINGFFGMLSTRGIKLELREKSNSQASTDASTIIETRLDAPYTTISISEGPSRPRPAHSSPRNDSMGTFSDELTNLPRLRHSDAAGTNEKDLADEDALHDTLLEDSGSHFENLEAAYQSVKAASEPPNTVSTRYVSSIPDDDVLEREDIIAMFNDVEGNKAAYMPTILDLEANDNIQPRSSPASEFTVRKYVGKKANDGPTKAFDRYLDFSLLMDEDATRAYGNALLQGATTGQALRQIGRGSKNSSKSHEFRIDLNAKEDFGEEEPQFRIIRHPSMGKAIERYDGRRITRRGSRQNTKV